MPKDMHANYLKMNKRTITDLKVTKQQVTGDKASFQFSGKDPAGQDLMGTADLIKEGAPGRSTTSRGSARRRSSDGKILCLAADGRPDGRRPAFLSLCPTVEGPYLVATGPM
jgi:hypothetical protein